MLDIVLRSTNLLLLGNDDGEILKLKICEMFDRDTQGLNYT